MEIAFDQFIHSFPQLWGFSVSVNFHLAAKVENAVQRKYFSRCKVFGNECLFCKIAMSSIFFLFFFFFLLLESF